MSPFPAVDPIPLPAPIWLFKLLHIVTLSLHFLAVQMLLGGLLLAVVLSLFPSGLSRVAARALARRLTVVMTFVINLAVPPLLFAQVLYGRALYTSSVLIGLYWISIIVLLMLVYWLLYKFSARLEAGRSGWWIGLSAWLVAGLIARLLSSNMTLMLRPEVWRQMYSASAAGAYLPAGDPTLTPRWLLMLAGGLFVGGLWMVYLAGRSTFHGGGEALSWRARRQSGRCLRAGLSGRRIVGSRRAARYRQGRACGGRRTTPFTVSPVSPAMAGWRWWQSPWLLRGFAGFARIAAGWLGWAFALLALLVEITFTVYRDGVRDLTLLSKGFDVWNRVVVTNWSVVGLVPGPLCRRSG